jgi:hypothetical protein
MKRYKPLPSEHVRAFRQSLGLPTLDELLARLGSPAHEIGPSAWTAQSPGEPVETIHHTRSLVFQDVTPLIKTMLVHICEDGRFDWEFRGRELSDEHTMA